MTAGDQTAPRPAAPAAAQAHVPSERGPRPQILLALFATGVLAFNFPLLMVWDADVSVFGLPLLPVALFAIWAALIAALAVASERRPKASPPILPLREGAPQPPAQQLPTEVP
ncbi:hypothetical protein [Xanthobacter oligotrophicus]|uniref:hypothetical protein n=1 Tax=Xanthobacter oligotrophicus TaxID=2607286 RepID=UPI0011F3D57C|nr:hypothetical protein [Xanthobacter oligotrophicus]MCG5234593.1 hypothetical protein [Xanthobacter oligotrophicus]